MSLNFLEELKKAPPKKRAKLLHEMHEKNVKFFTKRNADLGQFIQDAGTGGHNISINDDFLEVIHLESGMLCHPKTGLERYVKELGSSHHSGWIDKLKITHFNYEGIEHGEKLNAFLSAVYPALPILEQRIASGEISLPKLPDKRRFSGMTIFLGTFLGFHIAHYLLNTEVRDVVIIEPDLYKFALSCWFLDYAAIEKRFGRLVLHVGPDMPTTPEAMIENTGITSSAWLRLLPAYPSELFDEVIHRLELRWRALSEIFVPFDREVRNLGYGLKNLQLKRPINYLSPTLSENSRIAVVASGPSLDKDMDWLRENQNKLIIFAAHSAVKSLKRNGIRPDFQCSLDTELESSLLDKLELDSEIPFVSYYKANPVSLERFKTVLLVNESGKANPVKFKHLLKHTHPTTGNLSTATAAYAKPKKLYLIGLDLGTKNVHRDHVSGYWAEKPEDAPQPTLTKEQLSELGIIPIAANFSESEGKIYTHAYHNNARKAIEFQLAEIVNEVEIFNLSDGAKISHTISIHSQDLKLTDYVEKQQDIEKIIASFATEGEFWQNYQHPISKVLEVMCNTFENAMTMKKFDWVVFTQKLDEVTNIILRECAKLEAGDIRIEAYHKLLVDLATEWYRVMAFTQTPRESEILYQKGLENILLVLKSLSISPSLQEIE